MESFSIPTLAESLREAIRPDCHILFALHTSRNSRYTVLPKHAFDPLKSLQQTQTTQQSTQTHSRLKALTFHPTAPTSHSQWSSRSTEYTRRSRTCRPEATGSCRNSAVRAWASSRSESLRTLCCKWGADKSLAVEGKKTFGKVLVSRTIADLVEQCKPERTPRRCCLLCTQHRDQERGYD